MNFPVENIYEIFTSGQLRSLAALFRQISENLLGSTRQSVDMV